MIGHVGAKVSALVDGQLPAAETERLWAHVHRCAQCQAAVEREGWVKRQLAGLAYAAPPAPSYGLLGALAHPAAVPADPLGLPPGGRRRLLAGVAAGAGSIGVAMAGVIALSVPAETPTQERRTPTVSVNQPTLTPATPVRGRISP